MVATAPKQVPNEAPSFSRLWQTPHVQVRFPDETVQFLERHPEIERLLVEAVDAARSIIAPDTELAFELLHDPDEHETIPYVFILTKLDPDVALNRFDDFNDRWWRKRFASISTPISFSVEYV
jgi:hypothetical protein